MGFNCSPGVTLPGALSRPTAGASGATEVTPETGGSVAASLAPSPPRHSSAARLGPIPRPQVVVVAIRGRAVWWVAIGLPFGEASSLLPNAMAVGRTGRPSFGTESF